MYFQYSVVENNMNFQYRVVANNIDTNGEVVDQRVFPVDSFEDGYYKLSTSWLYDYAALQVWCDDVLITTVVYKA